MTTTPQPPPSAPQPPATPQPPGAVRRQQLKQERRADRLRQLWQLLVFLGLATGLGWVLLRQGWNLRDASQVEVVGSRLVSREQVIQAAGLQFPQPLITLEPRALSRTLTQALPVEQVQVSRTILPPRLRFELVDREAVARAERRTPRGPEAGYIDRLGSWISAQQHDGVRVRRDLSLRVVGWNERHRPTLARVLAHRGQLGSGLEEVRFEPDGSLWLVTTPLGRIRLGPSDNQVDRRLDVAAYLLTTLPPRLAGRKPSLIDLSDPEQPELSLPGGSRLPSGTSLAGPPQGGQ
ncbi:MAG: FtsQ-type POTRA domain-containing protein [Cyanobacteriota bacterium]|nr:FtsQ-type POTRA domain-containing protein [Cyanobacteriota bacterium]